jgi:hypothetical protein
LFPNRLHQPASHKRQDDRQRQSQRGQRTDTPTVTPTITLTLTGGPTRTVTPTLAFPTGPVTIDYVYDDLNTSTSSVTAA